MDCFAALAMTVSRASSLRAEGEAIPAAACTRQANSFLRRSTLASCPLPSIGGSDPMFSMSGKICVVTGAGRGPGRGIALAYAEQGADLVLASRTRGDLGQVAGL